MRSWWAVPEHLCPIKKPLREIHSGFNFLIIKHVLCLKAVDMGDVVKEAELGGAELAHGVGQFDHGDCGKAGRR